MLRIFIISTFNFLLLLGCNSERALLRRIAAVEPFIFQFGLESRLSPEANLASEVCNGFAYDPQDESFYCAGLTTGHVSEPHGASSHGISDALLIKFDRKKKVSWVWQRGLITGGGTHSSGESMNSVVLDHRGHGYVLARIEGSRFLIKFTTSGRFLWQKPIGSCSSIKFDNAIYCSGSVGTSPNEDAMITKYDIDGNFVWTREINPTYGLGFLTDKDDRCQSIAISQHGLIACTGFTYSRFESSHSPDPAKKDGFVWILDKEGNTVGLKQVGTNDYNEEFYSVAFDSQGNIVATGRYNGRPINKDTDVEADPSKHDLFPDEVNFGANNTFTALLERNDFSFPTVKLLKARTNVSTQVLIKNSMFDNKDRLILCGHSYGSLNEDVASTAPVESDLILFIWDIKQDALISRRQFGATTKGRFNNLQDQDCHGLATDQLGNIIAAGITKGSTQEPLGGVSGVDSDIMIWRLGPNLEF